MLRSLHIENYVLIDSLDIDFPEGLVIITGQTGAGKSILLGALSLLTGAKADVSVIAAGASSCVVEAEFDIDPDRTDIRDLLEENEVEWEDGHLTVRRVVSSTGRSRSFVNDSPVPVTLLSELSSSLVDIHSQHQSLMLASKQYQLGILDRYAGNGGLLSEISGVYSLLRDKERELASLEQTISSIEADRDYNSALWEQLDKASLSDPDELASLETEQKQLSNAEEIKKNLAAALQLLTPSGDDADGICRSLREAARFISKTASYIPAAEPLSERMESCRIDLEDIASDIEKADSRITVSEERLAAVEERMSLLYTLLKRNACTSISELIALRDSLGEKLFDSTALEQKRKALKSEIEGLEGRYADLSGKLHDSRTGASAAFAAEIKNALRFLELERAEFAVDIEEAAPSASGTDSVVFRFSSTGGATVDVAKCASGGEMSRIMLCLKEMMARYCQMPTMIFDEIDTGVSGSAADKMGSMICRMGENMQVFAITHLPQVAAKGRAHYVVTKSEGAGGRVVSGIRALDREGRINELARLLSGAKITPEALANAESLLSQN